MILEIFLSISFIFLGLTSSLVSFSLRVDFRFLKNFFKDLKCCKSEILGANFVLVLKEGLDRGLWWGRGSVFGI